MNAQTDRGLARPCRCDHPLLDGETCVRCGRPPTVLPAPSAAPPRATRPTWTRARVIRAMEAFAFFRGRAPVRADWNARMPDDWPPLEVVTGLFGSVSGAVRAAGLEASDRERRRPA